MSTPSIFRGRSCSLKIFCSPASPFFGSMKNTSGCSCVSSSPRSRNRSIISISSRNRAACSNRKLAEASAISSRMSLSELLAIPLQKHSQPLDVVAIFLLANPQIARSRALVDRRQQTRPKPTPAIIVGFDIERARAKFEHFLQGLHGAAQAARIGEGPVQLCTRRIAARE